MTGHAWALFVGFLFVGGVVGFLTAIANRPKEPTLGRFFAWWGAVAMAVALGLSIAAALFVGKFGGWMVALDEWGPVFGSMLLLALAIAVTRIVMSAQRRARVAAGYRVEAPPEPWHLTEEARDVPTPPVTPVRTEVVPMVPPPTYWSMSPDQREQWDGR